MGTVQMPPEPVQRHHRRRGDRKALHLQRDRRIGGRVQHELRRADSANRLRGEATGHERENAGSGGGDFGLHPGDGYRAVRVDGECVRDEVTLICGWRTCTGRSNPDLWMVCTTCLRDKVTLYCTISDPVSFD